MSYRAYDPYHYNRELMNDRGNILALMRNHPQCCKPGQRYLAAFKGDLLKAWEKCGDPFFICWCLDFMVDHKLEPGGSPGDGGYIPMSLFYMRPWHMKKYRDFMEYELQVWKWLLPYAFKLLAKPKIALFLYWLTTGYAEDRRTAYWWAYTASMIKGIRPEWIFLEVEKEIQAD